jgi:hypothetical protein
MEQIAVRTVRPGTGNRFGARKYATVASFSREGTEYQVVKVRELNSRNYSYKCTCPDHVFRNRDCKHIKAFQVAESN